MWDQLLYEADKNGDGMVSEDEFADAMSNIIKNSLKQRKKGNRNEVISPQGLRNTVKPVTKKSSLIYIQEM